MSDSDCQSQWKETQQVYNSWEHTVFHPEFDELFDCFSHHYRRRVLFLLKEEAINSESDILSWVEKQPERAMTELKHRHLPKLESAGFIHWNQRTGSLSKGPRFDEASVLFDFLERYFN